MTDFYADCLLQNVKYRCRFLFELWESGENQGSFEAGVGQALS